MSTNRFCGTKTDLVFLYMKLLLNSMCPMIHSSIIIRTYDIMTIIAAEGSTLFFTSPFPVRELYAAKKSILGCLYIRKDHQIYDVFWRHRNVKKYYDMLQIAIWLSEYPSRNSWTALWTMTICKHVTFWHEWAYCKFYCMFWLFIEIFFKVRWTFDHK